VVAAVVIVLEVRVVAVVVVVVDLAPIAEGHQWHVLELGRHLVEGSRPPVASVQQQQQRCCYGRFRPWVLWLEAYHL